MLTHTTTPLESSLVTRIRSQVRATRGSDKNKRPAIEAPVLADISASNAAAAERTRARADGGGNGGDARARAFRREVRKRLRRRELETDAELRRGKTAARVAIVGAGPVGLWLAVLLARKHASFTNGPNGPCITRNKGAPTIDVFEQRKPGGGKRGSRNGEGSSSSGGGGLKTNSKAHGARSIVLAITNNTSDLLNRHLLGPTIDRCGGHVFAPTSRIGEVTPNPPSPHLTPPTPYPTPTDPTPPHLNPIPLRATLPQVETVLAAEFEQYSSAGLGSLNYENGILDPDELHEEANGG